MKNKLLSNMLFNSLINDIRSKKGNGVQRIVKELSTYRQYSKEC